MAEKPTFEEGQFLAVLAKSVAEEHRISKKGADYRDMLGTGLVPSRYICGICSGSKEAEWPCKPYRWAVRYLTDVFMETLKAFSED